VSLPQRQGIRCVIVAPNHIKIFDDVVDIHILEDMQPTLKPETYIIYSTGKLEDSQREKINGFGPEYADAAL